MNNSKKLKFYKGILLRGGFETQMISGFNNACNSRLMTWNYFFF